METLEQRIRKLMEERGISTVAELAERARVNRSHIYDVWKNENAATLDTLRKLARGLKATVAAIVGEEPIPADGTPYMKSGDVRAVADLLYAKPIAARHFANALRSFATRDEVAEAATTTDVQAADRTIAQWTTLFPVDPEDFVATGDGDYPLPLHGWNIEDLRGAAGPNAARTENPMSTILNAKEVREGRVRTIKVQGNSMEPTIKEGCVIVVDLGKRNPKNDDPVAIYRPKEKGIILGRWERRGKRRRLLKDNDAASPVEIEDDDLLVGTIIDIIKQPIGPPPPRRRK